MRPIFVEIAMARPPIILIIEVLYWNKARFDHEIRRLVKLPYKKIVTKFLDIEIDLAGWLPSTKDMASSVVARKPVVLQKNLDKGINKNFTEIAKSLVGLKPNKSNGVMFFNE